MHLALAARCDKVLHGGAVEVAGDERRAQRRRRRGVGVQVDISESTNFESDLLFKQVQPQVLSTQGQHDVFNMMCST